MDFQELLSHADYNASEAKYQGSTKKYSSVLPPPKKVPKPNVQSENIRRFLEKKKAEEEAKALQAQREKERLLALRAQNTKSNKKAKIMASRTKDNDFSKIKLTDDELEAKKRREAELLRKNLNDKVERMKARIEMEEKEKMMPRKRKRKSKNGEVIENHDDHVNIDVNDHEDHNSYAKNSDSNHVQKQKVQKPKPPPPNMSFMDLLKIAEKRQVDPIEIPIKKKEEEKLLTKKERKLMEEEQARLRRKQERERERLMQMDFKQKGSSKTSSAAPQGGSAKPVVIHVGKDAGNEQSGKFKIPKNTSNSVNHNSVPVKNINTSINAKSSVNTSSKSSVSTSVSSKSSVNTNSNSKPSVNSNILSKSSVNTSVSSKNVNSNIKSKSSGNLSISDKPSKSVSANGQIKVKPRDESASSKDLEMKKKMSLSKKQGLNNSVQAEKPKTVVSAPALDEEALKAKLEKELREKLEKELEERIAAKFAQFQNSQPKVTQKVSEEPKQAKKEPQTVSNTARKAVEKASGIFKKDMERMIQERKKAMENSSLKPKLPEKKVFHKNPYLDPPRRLLEPQRPPRPLMKRRIESDDEDDDDDDMSDFIDDGPSQNDEDYSKYIKEIFGYDRNKYLDIDDDDIQESSFAEQMKEEVRSARLGYLEDLEEEKLEMERLKKKKKKLKK